MSDTENKSFEYTIGWNAPDMPHQSESPWIDRTCKSKGIHVIEKSAYDSLLFKLTRTEAELLQYLRMAQNGVWVSTEDYTKKIKALQFYADKTNWDYAFEREDIGHVVEIRDDAQLIEEYKFGGRRAREALK